ncbi:uncharacterized protein AMSG_05822 [Thecamonas trahens ATCC 50062]|uniref:KATNIP domain-containing protein n=1 Tax=Thecamonas trahens ATCC 50062 TaxID=461836 RepID=A0A0L0DCM2_THETB|nr:hypothetical protein AMSG_05822 [Thecamonas trahens ATCC 50062]KNC50059.1 hypothetical protein AMSG_05822 [Thecamonas trahens ATCC 50062]|eukprot:XP_013757224.1 hypothetical protein AMSG_05822 [Thecamonas trahens ATCC 50062]
MIDRLPGEVLHLIAYHVDVLGAGEVVAMAATCKAVHTALLGSTYSTNMAKALLGWDSCLARRLWGGARMALRRGRRWEPRAVVRAVFDDAEPDDDEWRLLVREMAVRGAAVRVNICGSVGKIVWWNDSRDLGIGAVAVAYGLEDVALGLLGEVSRSDQTQMFVLGAQMGMAKLVVQLLADDSLDVAAEDNYAIRYAAKSGHAEMVRLLLADPRIDPAADASHAIRWASRNGHTEVVRLLLADPRVDPAADNNFAVSWAFENEHASVFKLLLADPRVELPADHHEALRWAAEFGHVDVVELLLADPAVDPAANDCDALRWAAAMGHAAVIAVLLQDGRVDPCVGDNFPIRITAEKGHLAAVKLLLCDQRVDPSADSNYAVRKAHVNGHLDVVTVLVADPRVEASVIGDLSSAVTRAPSLDPAEYERYLALLAERSRLVSKLKEAEMDPETKAREKAFSTYFSGAHAEAAPSAAGGGGCANGAARSSPPRRADAPSAGTTAGGRRRKAWGTPQAPVILAPEAGQASPRVKARWQRDSLHIAGPGGKAIHVSKAQSARALLQAGPLSTESGSGLGSDSDSGASLGSGDSELEAVSGTGSSSRDIEANVAAKVAALSSSKQRMVVRLLDRLADLDIESETSGDGDVRSSLDLLQRLLASARSPARSPAARSPAVQSPAGVAETVDRSPLMLPVGAASTAASTPTRTPLMSPAATVDTPDSLASPTRAASPMALPASRPVARPQFDTLIECTPLRILLSRGDQTTAISLGNVQLFDASGQSVTVLADSQVSLAGVAGPSKLDTSALFDEAAPQWLVPRARDAPAVVVSIAIPSIVPLASVVLTNSNEAASAASWVVVKWDGRQVWSGELALGGSARVNLCGPESAKLSENAAPANRLETDGVAVEASAATEAVPAKVVAAQVLPTEVHSLRLIIRSTHGHRTRVGLTNLSLVDSAGVVIPIDPELDVEVEGLDPSGPAWQAAITPMFNGVTATCSPDDMWLGWLMSGFEPHVEITISYAWTGQARQLVLHNYNASLKDSVKCVRGLQVWHDRELVWEGEVSEAKGNAVFPYQHVVELESDVSASYDAPSSLTLSATGGSSPERGGRGTESASPEQASPAPSPPAVWQAPMASTITLNILSTWGDPFYVGMTGLEIIDAETRQPIPLTASALEASPASLNDLDEVSGDPRTVDKLVDGEVATRDDTHMWLILYPRR